MFTAGYYGYSYGNNKDKRTVGTYQVCPQHGKVCC